MERDSFALWDERGASEQASRVVDSASVDDPGCRRVLEAYDAAGVGVVMFDLTTDVELPAFSATIVDRRTDVARRATGRSGGARSTPTGQSPCHAR